MIVYRCLFEGCFWTVQWVSFLMVVSTVGVLLTVVFDGGQYSEHVFGGVWWWSVQWMSFAKQLLTTASTVESLWRSFIYNCKQVFLFRELIWLQWNFKGELKERCKFGWNLTTVSKHFHLLVWFGHFTNAYTKEILSCFKF